jgi:hypothetical protein
MNVIGFGFLKYNKNGIILSLEISTYKLSLLATCDWDYFDIEVEYKNITSYKLEINSKLKRYLKLEIR